MKRSSLLVWSALFLALGACGGGGPGGSGGGSSRMRLTGVSNGFGTILPHRAKELGPDGQPTTREIELTTIDQIIRTVSAANPILPPTSWRETAELPDGTPGNHFVVARFSRPLDVDSVLDGSVGAVGGLRNSIQVLVFDPNTNTTVQVPGRAFVGGATYGLVDNRPPPEGDPSRRLLEQWIVIENGVPVLNRDLEGYDFMEGGVFIPERHPGFGFPGAQIDSSTPSFPGATDLISSRSFVFVPDATPGLDSFETFPVGQQVRMRVTRVVRSVSGQELLDEALASATVGDDDIRPEVAVSGQANKPSILPEDGEIDVDPTTSITVEFTEPVQPFSVGEIDPKVTPQPSAGIQVQFGPPTKLVTVPYTVKLFSPFDLSRVELVPTFNFPSNTESVSGVSCGVFGEITIQVNADQLTDLNGLTNVETPSSRFKTGDGPALVNVPVAPDVIYLTRSGSKPGLSVIDLNGFGQGTGNPDYNGISDPIEKGNSNFPNNPNLQLGPTLFPPLQQGTCTVDGGSEGVFTLAKDSALNDLVVRAPIIESVGDMMIGFALDTSFNNGTPFGCQAGGGNLCAFSGLKTVQLTVQSNSSVSPTGVGFQFQSQLIGVENLMSWTPHPNPPPLVFPPLCLSPLIGGAEPTSIDVFFGPMGIGGVQNLLTPGPGWQGDPAIERPPTDLLAGEQNMFFLGPSGPPQPGQGFSGCTQYMMRQQVGHFLYLVDQVAGEVVVLNSNRMTVIERIRLPDPTSLAMSPNLDLLAVSNRRAGVVSFIDTNPASSSFHEIVKTTRVGRGPTGIAWGSDNEDLLVCNEDDNSVSVISAFNLEARKTLRNIIQPFDVAITPRQINFGLLRNVYYAYILSRTGRVSLFESGPDGTNGWGFDQIVATFSFQFDNPKAIKADPTFLNSGIWVIHENPLDEETGMSNGQIGGAITNVAILSGRVGPVALNMGQLSDPSVRDLEIGIRVSIGPEELTGVPTDLAFDYQVNISAYPNFSTFNSAGTPSPINGKSIVRFNQGTCTTTPSFSPRFMFLAVPSPTHFDPGDAQAGGVVDVIDITNGFRRIDTNPFDAGIQSIPATGVTRVVDYFRQ